jgi:hypothetical protein
MPLLIMNPGSTVFDGKTIFHHKAHEGHEGKTLKNQGLSIPLCTSVAPPVICLAIQAGECHFDTPYRAVNAGLRGKALSR